MRKGNYTLLARKLAAAVGWERLILQPFDLWLGFDAGCRLGKLLEHSENIGDSSGSTTEIMWMALEIKHIKPPKKKCILPTLMKSSKIHDKFFKSINIHCDLAGVLQLLVRIMGRFLSLVLCQVAAAWAERRSCPYYQVGDPWVSGSVQISEPIRGTIAFDTLGSQSEKVNNIETY